jgi:hypothetical protein
MDEPVFKEGKYTTNYINEVAPQNQINTEFDFDSIYRKNFDNLNCLIYHGLSNYCFFGLPDSDTYWNCYTIKSEKMNKIMSLNGSIRSHRILFLLYLIENKLVDKLLCSFKFYTHNDSNTFNEEMYISFLEEFRRLNYINSNEINTLIDYKQHLPITIDKFDLNDRKINVDTFSSVVNVVTENTYDYTSCIDVRETNTFTEKTLIPFIIEQIPIFVSLPNHVQFLRDIGYDVFDDLIDHSYDREPDGIKRMKMIVSEIQRIIDIDFVSFYHNNRTRFLKNRELTIYNTYNGYTKVREFLIENKLF